MNRKEQIKKEMDVLKKELKELDSVPYWDASQRKRMHIAVSEIKSMCDWAETKKGFEYWDCVVDNLKAEADRKMD
jgi:hypothetical protein